MSSSIYQSWENHENGHDIDSLSKCYRMYFWCQKGCLGNAAQALCSLTPSHLVAFATSMLDSLHSTCKEVLALRWFPRNFSAVRR